ncbi:hypothetical protein [Escherichia coli]|uniref:hypothetical protein n=1 Tax=Escherichia coli TaxID=562 RepID=UPI000A6CCFCA|nr:hypothetical protein [Escherichia coli]
MKKIALTLLSTLIITGCTAQSSAENRNSDHYAYLKKCENITLDNMPQQVNKNNFLKLLYKGEMIINTTQFITSSKQDMLVRVGWDPDISKAIADCDIEQMMIVLNAAKEPFEKLKANTKSPTEREALIKTYSAWENYVSSPSRENKNNFNEKASYYKNI